jgi:hypothetical protein
MSIRQERPGIHPAFPVSHKTFLHSEWNGLSKREYVATALLAGLLARRAIAPKRFKSLAHYAISHADELLQQLLDAPV